MPKYDGSITLSTKVDMSGIKTGIVSIKDGVNTLLGSVTRLGAAIGIAFGVGQLVTFGKEAVSLASDLQEVQNVVDTSFGSLTYKMEEFADTAIETYGISKLVAKQTGSTYMAMANGIGLANDTAADMALKLTGLSADMASFYNVSQDVASTALSSVFTGETETLKKYGIVMTETNLTQFAMEQGITKNISAMTQQEKTLLRYNYVMQQTSLAHGDFAKTSESWANQTRILSERWKEVKTTFGEAFMTLAQLVLPAVNKLISGLAVVAKYAKIAATNIASLFGKEIKKDTTSIDNKVSSAADNVAAIGSNAETSAKKLKKLTAGFDELDILTSNAEADSAGSTDYMSNISPDFNGLENSGDYDTSPIDSKLAELMELIGGCLIAVGIVLLFTGNIGWGIGFIIAGAATFAVAEALSEDGDPTAIPKEKIAELAVIVGGALAVLGVIMIFLGQYAIGMGAIIEGIALFGVGSASIKEGGMAEKITKFMKENEDAIVMASFAMLIFGVLLLIVPAVKKLALGLIAAGVVGLAAEVALNEGSIGEKISKFLDDNASLIICASLVFLVLGIIFCLFGIKLPLAIGMIALGVAGLVTEMVLHWDLIKEKVGGFLQNNASLIVLFSLLDLVLGIILCMTGVELPLGIALIVTGIAGLVTEVVLHWDLIKEKISSFFKENAEFATVGSIAMLVLGIVLVCTGVGLPVGIALILAGVAGLVTVVAFNKDAILEKIKSVWKSIKDFWNKHIAPVFTAKWWGDLAKNAINGFLEWIFNGLNSLIRKLNSFGFDLPEVLGGGRVGFNLSEFTIPKLAKGGIVPYATTAVIGEAGREAVLPLENNTEWMDMLADRIVLRNGGSGRTTTVILELDGRELGRAVVNAGNEETRRIGTRLVVT